VPLVIGEFRTGMGVMRPGPRRGRYGATGGMLGGTGAGMMAGTLLMGKPPCDPRVRVKRVSAPVQMVNGNMVHPMHVHGMLGGRGNRRLSAARAI
jgi:hypothetical protein